MANKLLAKLKKEKAFNDILITEQPKDEWLSTNCIPVNLLLSGKIQGGIKKGCMSQISADSSFGKSIIGYSVLKTAQQAGMDCFIVDTENAVNYKILSGIGVDMKDVGVINTKLIPEIKQFFSKMAHGLTRAEQRNVFVLFDSWGPIVELQVMEKAEEGSAAVNMSSARFKAELAEIINACNFTTLILNHVYATLQMYGDPVTVGGGKKLYFLSDAIMLATSAKKDKDKEGNIRGKIITAKTLKGRAAKEMRTTHYLIQHNGGINPYYGLLDEAIESGAVYKPKPGYYSRTDYDIDKETGEVTKQWKEEQLYCAEFWIPLYKDEKFKKYVENKFSYDDSVLIASNQDVMKLISGEQEIVNDGIPDTDDEIDLGEDEE